jgi:hypothetical protein
MTEQPYVFDVASLERGMTPRDVEAYHAMRLGIRRYTGFHAVCDCGQLEPFCACPPSPSPSWWRRVFRRN